MIMTISSTCISLRFTFVAQHLLHGCVLHFPGGSLATTNHSEMPYPSTRCISFLFLKVNHLTVNSSIFFPFVHNKIYRKNFCRQYKTTHLLLCVGKSLCIPLPCGHKSHPLSRKFSGPYTSILSSISTHHCSTHHYGICKFLLDELLHLSSVEFGLVSIFLCMLVKDSNDGGNAI